MRRPVIRRDPSLLRAFDEARFGRERTLDLRTSLPTARDADARVDAWLRERQASVGGEVLIITGRGRGSEGGVAVVRPVVERRLTQLKRQGVIESVGEHSPGSFVVVLAPMRALLDAARRGRDQSEPEPPHPAELRKLPPETRAVLHELALASLHALGAPHTRVLVTSEIAHVFSRLVHGIPAGPDREARLHAAALAALDDLRNGEQH